MIHYMAIVSLQVGHSSRYPTDENLVEHAVSHHAIDTFSTVYPRTGSCETALSSIRGGLLLSTLDSSRTRSFALSTLVGKRDL